MDLARRIYSRELKLATMREIDGGRTISERSTAGNADVEARTIETQRKIVARGIPIYV